MSVSQRSSNAPLPIGAQIAFVLGGAVLLRGAYEAGASARVVATLGTALLVALLWAQRKLAQTRTEPAFRDPSQVTPGILGTTFLALVATGVVAYLAGSNGDAGWSAVAVFVGVVSTGDYVVRAAAKNPVR